MISAKKWGILVRNIKYIVILKSDDCNKFILTLFQQMHT
jgi:hypothetical protein